ncbi:MAG: acyl-CoA dehydrogenase [Caulobacteraceae bacterium]|nr:acyl-CoA dehydrogenase [Caulobacteraceae bacterium]
MNFDDTPEEAAFRQEVRTWIQANAPHHLKEALSNAGFGSGPTGIDTMAEAKAWQKKKAEAGWACLHWPKEYGGRGATPIERVIWGQEEGVYSTLGGSFIIGHGMCGPTVMAFASEEQKRRYLPPLAAGEEVWCQLFSEPAGGSDLAGLRTKAEPAKDGSGDWIINGQKIWTSGAHYSDFGILITRTDPTVPKHKGLTMFFLDMRSPGVEIRPIKQVNGQSGFNEVYFTDVRIPDSQRLGAVGGGWQVSLTTLMNERLSIGAGMSTGFPELLDLCCRIETANGLAVDDPAVRSKLATWAVRQSGLKYTGFRAISALSRGEIPGPENSIGKLVAGATMQDIAALALDLQAESGVINDPEISAANARFQAMLLRSPATRVEGGTDEILRNIIAERVLGLPADIRVDKDVPFNQIPTSGARA